MTLMKKLRSHIITTALVTLPIVSLSADERNTVAIYNKTSTDRSGGDDWDMGFWKATCSPQETIVGLSIDPKILGGGVAALCRTGIPTSTRAALLIGPKDQRRAKRLGDWDPGFVKLECGEKEFVSGISQYAKQARPFHGLRCSSGAGSTEACETRVVTKGQGYSGSYGDWSVNNYKADCPMGKSVVGVSVSADGNLVYPHALLCCKTQESPPAQQGEACGMPGMVACASELYCNQVCGQVGQCARKPWKQICEAEAARIVGYQPICGCDLRVYTTECFAQLAGVSKAYRGQCVK